MVTIKLHNFIKISNSSAENYDEVIEHIEISNTITIVINLGSSWDRSIKDNRWRSYVNHPRIYCKSIMKKS